MKATTDRIEVAKIDIKIGDKTISLKPEQAKELKKILNEMFEEKVIDEHHYDHYRYWWTQPIYTASGPYPQWTITCIGESSSGVSVLGNTCNTVQLALNS